MTNNLPVVCEVVCSWLASRPGWHSTHTMAMCLHLSTDDVRDAVAVLSDQGLVMVECDSAYPGVRWNGQDRAASMADAADPWHGDEHIERAE